MLLPIKIHDDRLREERYYPKYAKPGDLGIDLRACVRDPIVLNPGSSVRIPVGFAVDMHKKLRPPTFGDDWGLGGIIIPRSGLGSRGLVVGNLVGLIDEGYQGQIEVTAWNRGEYGLRNRDDLWTEATQIVLKPMMRFAQIFFTPILRPELCDVDEFSHTTERGAGGFWSTGSD